MDRLFMWLLRHAEKAGAMLRIVGSDASLFIRTAVGGASEAEVVAELAA